MTKDPTEPLSNQQILFGAEVRKVIEHLVPAAVATPSKKEDCIECLGDTRAGHWFISTGSGSCNGGGGGGGKGGKSDDCGKAILVVLFLLAFAGVGTYLAALLWVPWRAYMRANRLWRRLKNSDERIKSGTIGYTWKRLREDLKTILLCTLARYLMGFIGAFSLLGAAFFAPHSVLLLTSGTLFSVGCLCWTIWHNMVDDPDVEENAREFLAAVEAPPRCD